MLDGAPGRPCVLRMEPSATWQAFASDGLAGPLGWRSPVLVGRTRWASRASGHLQETPDEGWREIGALRAPAADRRCADAVGDGRRAGRRVARRRQLRAMKARGRRTRVRRFRNDDESRWALSGVVRRAKRATDGLVLDAHASRAAISARAGIAPRRRAVRPGVSRGARPGVQQ